MSEWIPCPTPKCMGDARYAAPGRGHADDCTYPANVTDPAVRMAVERNTPRTLDGAIWLHHPAGAMPAGILCACDMQWRDVPTYGRHIRESFAALVDRPADLDLLEDPDGAPYPEEVQAFVAQYQPLQAPSDDAFRQDMAAALESVIEPNLARHRQEWADWLESWSSAVGPEPPTVEAVIRWLRADTLPFGKMANPASGESQ